MRIKWHHNAKCLTLYSLNMSCYLPSHSEVEGLGDIELSGSSLLGKVMN